MKNFKVQGKSTETAGTELPLPLTQPIHRAKDEAGTGLLLRLKNVLSCCQTANATTG
ncbi:hypothetical protein SAMN05660916_00326 [Arthrobacter sp. 31Cvi3.1E]|nr:hypothetical protein SAMN05660916_00326 [Arthrobacter sp. 31Cvi3.1E]